MDEVLAYQTVTGTLTQRFYPHANHLYSVAALTNAAGQVVERYKYDAYGKMAITSPTGAVRAKSAVGWDRGFTGYVADNETGLMYARSRMYSPTLGVFVSRDPWLYIDGYSVYQAYFVPNEVDPSGLGLSNCRGFGYGGHSRQMGGTIAVVCTCIDDVTGRTCTKTFNFGSYPSPDTNDVNNIEAYVTALKGRAKEIADSMNGKPCSCPCEDPKPPKSPSPSGGGGDVSEKDPFPIPIPLPLPIPRPAPTPAPSPIGQGPAIPNPYPPGTLPPGTPPVYIPRSPGVPAGSPNSPTMRPGTGAGGGGFGGGGRPAVPTPFGDDMIGRTMGWNR